MIIFVCACRNMPNDRVLWVSLCFSVSLPFSTYFVHYQCVCVQMCLKADSAHLLFCVPEQVTTRSGTIICYVVQKEEFWCQVASPFVSSEVPDCQPCLWYASFSVHILPLYMSMWDVWHAEVELCGHWLVFFRQVGRRSDWSLMSVTCY